MATDNHLIRSVYSLWCGSAAQDAQLTRKNKYPLASLENCELSEIAAYGAVVRFGFADSNLSRDR